MSPPMCLICKADFPWPPDEEELPYYQKWPDEDRVGVGVCPTCRRHAEIGRRVVEREKSMDCYCNYQQMCWLCQTQLMLEEMEVKP